MVIIMKQHQSRFSLASLFLLVACLALVLAATRSSVMQWKDQNIALALVAAGAVIGAIVGAFVGASVRPRVRGAFAGLFTGAFAGGMAGAQLGGPPDILILLIGIMTLILLAALLRPKVTVDTSELGGSGSVLHPAARPEESSEG